MNFNEAHISPSHTFYRVWVQRFYSEVYSHPIGTQASLSLSKNCFSLHLHMGWLSVSFFIFLPPSCDNFEFISQSSDLSPSSPSFYILSPYFLFKNFFDEITSLIEDPCWFPLLKIEVGIGPCHLTNLGWKPSFFNFFLCNFGQLI